MNFKTEYFIVSSFYASFGIFCELLDYFQFLSVARKVEMYEVIWVNFEVVNWLDCMDQFLLAIIRFNVLFVKAFQGD